MIKLKADEFEFKNRQGIDLIVVIDVSGSMRGTKIELVKDTLYFLIKQLKDYDRLSFITFNDDVNFYTKLNPMTLRNKKEYEALVKDFVA